MKQTLVILLILIISISSSVALITLGFRGWPWLESRSQDIIIARCISTPPDDFASNDPSMFADIEVVSVLKGTNGLGPKRLRSMYRPDQGRYYLIFSTFHNDHYQALEEYRIVPLEYHFSTNMIANKPLDEQLKKLLHYRLDRLNWQMKKDEEEKKRLEEAFSK